VIERNRGKDSLSNSSITLTSLCSTFFFCLFSTRYDSIPSVKEEEYRLIVELMTQQENTVSLMCQVPFACNIDGESVLDKDIDVMYMDKRGTFLGGWWSKAKSFSSSCY